MLLSSMFGVIFTEFPYVCVKPLLTKLAKTSADARSHRDMMRSFVPLDLNLDVEITSGPIVDYVKCSVDVTLSFDCHGYPELYKTDKVYTVALDSRGNLIGCVHVPPSLIIRDPMCVPVSTHLLGNDFKYFAVIVMNLSIERVNSSFHFNLKPDFTAVYEI